MSECDGSLLFSLIFSTSWSFQVKERRSLRVSQVSKGKTHQSDTDFGVYILGTRVKWQSFVCPGIKRDYIRRYRCRKQYKVLVFHQWICFGTCGPYQSHEFWPGWPVYTVVFSERLLGEWKRKTNKTGRQKGWRGKHKMVLKRLIVYWFVGFCFSGPLSCTIVLSSLTEITREGRGVPNLLFICRVTGRLVLRWVWR